MDVDRRRFLQVASVGFAGATVLAGCGGSKQTRTQPPIAGEKPQNSSPAAPESDVSDVRVLNSALDLEHQAVAAYTAALGALRGANARTARTFRDHERAHVAALTAAIKSIGGTPNAASRSYRFPHFATETDALRFAARLENTAIAAYIDALPRLDTAAVRAEVASIVATEAEHLAVINGVLGARSAPTAFVTGQGAA